MSPLLAKYKLCILPKILERDCQYRRQAGGDILSHVALKVAFEFVAAVDGSSHRVEIWSEAADRADRATNKALASAYKYAAFQVFCIPVAGQADGDAETVRFTAPNVPPAGIEPAQGWPQRVTDISDMVHGCQTEEALRRIQTTYRRELHALSARAATRYLAVGDAFLKRRLQIETPPKDDAMTFAQPGIMTPVLATKELPANSLNGSGVATGGAQ